jgi:O-antigen/teichoic acid export membrane protein
MALSIAASLVTVPVNISHIPLDMYGAWLATGNILAWATLIDPGFGLLTQQQAALEYGAGNLGGAGKIITGGVLLNCIMAALLAGICSILIPWLPELLNLTGQSNFFYHQLQSACWVATLGLFLTVSSYAVSSSGYAIQGSIALGIIAVIAHSSAFFVQIALVIWGYGPLGIAWGSVSRGALLLLGGIGYLAYRSQTLNIPLRFDRDSIRQILRLTPFTLGARVFSTLSQNVSAFLLVRMVSPEAAVILRSTQSPFDLAVQFVNRPAAAIAPTLSHMAGAGELASKRTQLLRFMTFSVWMTSLAFCGLLSLNQAFVNLWVGSPLYAGWTTNLALSLGLVTLSASALFSNLTYALGSFRSTSLILAAQAILSLFAMVVGAHFFGLPGVAGGAALGGFISSLACAVVLFRSAFIDSKLWRVLFFESTRCFFSAALTIGFAFLILPLPSSWFAFMLQVLGVTAGFLSFLALLSKQLRSEICLFGKKIRTYFVGAS